MKLIAKHKLHLPGGVEFDESASIFADFLIEVVFGKDDDVVGEGGREEEQCCDW